MKPFPLFVALAVALVAAGCENDRVKQLLSTKQCRDCKLVKVDLSSADLAKADLSGADLTGANLTGADLSGADLTGAILSGANLKRAKLRDATLREAYFFQARFEGADLEGAKMDRTILPNGSVSQVTTISSKTPETKPSDPKLLWQMASGQQEEDKK
ncbi:pentapeptide repeat-containing protein [Geitlerinema sp. PCC 7407]|uniref:pentapeptide repeat-containing protein n=1 Tax=Geitlerinema sp. PCC 7407 TaxID=1173025 RepID=UPI00029F9696|nr:pentapeptide repeat-containing protein [Geitlerinema sp. PCC 7407]AFY67339.1 pentapeptide repeat protein [Geitlerinema sp. PCC 7407]